MLFYILLLWVFFFSSEFVYKSSATLINDVCVETEDPKFCIRVLESDPRTKSADLYILGEVTIDLATYHATRTKVKIHDLFLRSKSQERWRFDMCGHYYEDALDALRYAPENLKRANYASLKEDGRRCYDDGIDCENTFKEPSPIVSPLTDDNKNMENFGEMIAVISNLVTLSKFN